jgi:hypothetical protein
MERVAMDHGSATVSRRKQKVAMRLVRDKFFLRGPGPGGPFVVPEQCR